MREAIAYGMPLTQGTAEANGADSISWLRKWRMFLIKFKPYTR